MHVKSVVPDTAKTYNVQAGKINSVTFLNCFE